MLETEEKARSRGEEKRRENDKAPQSGKAVAREYDLLRYGLVKERYKNNGIFRQ